MEQPDLKDNGIVNVGGVNVNKEIAKEYWWRTYLDGRNLGVTGKVMQLEIKMNEVLEWANGLDLTTEQRLKLNEFKLQ